MAQLKIEIHSRKIDKRIDNLSSWNVPSSVIKDIKRFLEEAEMGKVNRGYKISEGRLAKYLDLLKTPLEFFNKEIEDIAMKDVEAFEKALSKGEIKKSHAKKREPYSKNTQIDINKAVKIFFKWKLGEAKAIELVGWLDVRPERKTPDFLNESEVERIYKECKTKEQRFLVAVLFDSGARAEEFHNIRYEDIHMPEGKENFVMITLKEEYSKTHGRTIKLFWKHSLDAVRDYVKQRIDEGVRPRDPIFNVPYDTARRFLYDMGRKLGKSLHYHLFRHSSATYYADKMNRQQLCIRYGWAFSSDMPDVYISRAGVDEKEMDAKFAATEISKMKGDWEKERRDQAIEMEAMKKQLEDMQRVFIGNFENLEKTGTRAQQLEYKKRMYEELSKVKKQR